MKICVISTPVFQLCPPQGTAGYSGLEVIAYQLAKGLAAKGHDVSVMAPDGSECPGTQIIPFGPAGRIDEKKAYKSYWKELVKYDVICDHSWAKWSYVLKAEGVLHAPVLGITHAPIATMYQTPPPIDKPCIVCISEDQASHWRAFHGNADCRTAHNGIDMDFYKAMDIPRTDRYLFLARFSSVKSPDLALKACQQAQVKLDLVGDNVLTHEPDYFNKCAAMCDGTNLRMVGPAMRGGAIWWYSQARAMIHLNKIFREPFGLAPVEAQACGLPVLCFDNGAMRETVVDGETGRVVKSFEDAVNVLMTNQLDAMSRDRCRENASRFSVDKMVSRYEELCTEAVDSGGW